MARKQAKAASANRPTKKKRASRGGSGNHKDVKVRMYCQGLGDCFLISLPRALGAEPFRILIDCGVLQGTKDDDAKLQAVARSLKTASNGVIDLLVVTHEHWDHVAGFSLAKSIFEQIQFNEVWLSWAEDPSDADARRLKTELGKKKNAVAKMMRAVEGRRAAAAGVSPAVSSNLQSTAQIMQFFGPAAASSGTSGKMSLGETMDWLREKVRPVGYRHPGECRTLPDVEGVKVYVLGPPRDPKRIRKMNPTGDQGYRHLAAAASILGVIDWLDNPESGLPPGPFDESYAVSLDGARADVFFREHYGFAGDPLDAGAKAWRRIDDEWLGSVGRLALQLDTGVNNTSLALAFELPDGRTMIFPGDAQIGNWLSWDDVKFTDESGKSLAVTSQELLHRAVFYKVGHHGSHNATRKTGGLESMTSGDLVAMIPTDQEFASTRKPPQDGWKMPFAGLYEALKKFTGTCVARADFNKSETEKLVKGSASGAAFLSRLSFSSEPLLPGLEERPLYVEYTLPSRP